MKRIDSIPDLDEQLLCNFKRPKNTQIDKLSWYSSLKRWLLFI